MYEQEIEKRRTFAIISHPDAGKTTLTEKFLLYGGAIALAGSVKRHVMLYQTGWKLKSREGFRLLHLLCSSIMKAIALTYWTPRATRISRKILTGL